MILHLSISVRDPRKAAEVIAELWGGRALPCPHPIEGSWIAFAGDERGTAVEVYPVGYHLVPTEGPVGTRTTRVKSAATGSHLALACGRSEEEIAAIGAREGWHTGRCDRGPYEVVELWIENQVLVEVLTPEMQRDYQASMTAENWARMFEPST